MLSDWIIRVRALLRRGTVERELDEEVRFHVDRRAEQLAASGIDPVEATRRARLEFGGVDSIKEECRDARGTGAVEAAGRTLRDASRAIRHRPGLAGLIVATLALGIGANTAVFSLLNSITLRPLPVPQPNQLVAVEGPTFLGTPWTYAIWQQIQQRRQLFGGVVAWADAAVNVSPSGEMEVADGLFASGSFFTTLGVPAARGRVFTEADDARGGGPDGFVMVISDTFWQRHFGGAEDVIGRTLRVANRDFTIVGVTPRGFTGLEIGRGFDLAMPIGAAPAARLDDRSTWWLTILARLRPDQTRESAEAALAGVQSQIEAATEPSGFSAKDLEQFRREVRFRLQPASTGGSGLRTTYARPLRILQAAVGVVLLIACANIASLLLVRASGRRHEMSVRLALGASRGQLVRQMLAESVLLSGAGAALGLAFAYWASRMLVQLVSTRTSVIRLDLSPDWRVIAFTGAVAVGTALVFGLAPARRATRVDPTQELKDQSRTVAAGGRMGLTDLLVVVQMALSLVLVIAAGLLLRTFATLSMAPLGFDADRLLIVRLQTPAALPPDQLPTLYDHVREVAAAQPGVSGASVSMITPISGAVWRTSFIANGGPAVPEDTRAFVNGVMPGWLATCGTAIRAGRDLRADDRTGSPNVAVVNEAFVRTFLGGDDPIGRTIVQNPTSETPVSMVVVGIAENTHYRSLRETFEPIVYVPLAQVVGMPHPERLSNAVLTVRAEAGPPVALAKSVGAAIARADPRLKSATMALTEQIGGSIRQDRLMATMSGFFGGLALLMASIGLYGVTKYSVDRRRRELGIRVMLGAPAGDMLWLTLRRVGVLVGAGVSAGLLISVWAAPVLSSLLFTLGPRDTTTFALSALLLVVVGGIAAWRPARSATRIDPIEILKD